MWTQELGSEVREAASHHDERERDHDAAQELVGDGVILERISDGLVAAEEASFEGVVLRGEDGKG